MMLEIHKAESIKNNYGKYPVDYSSIMNGDALFRHVKQHDIDKITLLLRNGVDIDSRDRDNNTPLMFAVKIWSI